MALVTNDITKREAILDLPLRTLLCWVTMRLEERQDQQRLLAPMFGQEVED